MNNAASEISAESDLNGINITGPLMKADDVREPGFYYTPSNTIEHQRMAHFDGQYWRFVGDNGRFSVRTLMGSVDVYGPFNFDQCIAPPEGNTWPDEGDEFTVFVDVRADEHGGFDGYVLNPPQPLANMLRHYGGEEMRMAEEYFGQDFLPESPGTYRMKLRMYIDPAYRVDDNEWTADEPGLEVLSVERLSFEACSTPALDASAKPA